MIRTRTVPGPNVARRGGAALFAFVFILLVAAALALYWFWYLPGQQKGPADNANESEDISMEPGGNANRTPRNEGTTDSNQPDSNAGNEDNGSGTDNRPPDNGSDNQPGNEPDDEPEYEDADVEEQVERAENAARQHEWRDVMRELRGATDRNLSEEMTNRVASLLSRAEVMDDFERIDSIRRTGMEKDDPIPVKIFLGYGESGQVVGSMYRNDLEKLWSASESGPLPPKFKAFDTSVRARDMDGEFLVARSIGGYEAVSFSTVAKVRPWDTDEMDDYYQSRVDRVREVYKSSSQTPVDKYLLACGLKRYGPDDEDHPWLQEAKRLIDDALRDDPYLAQSVECERSRDYQQYLQAVQREDDRMAETLLDELMNEYPQAAQLEEARAAGGARAAAKAMADAVQREADRASQNPAKMEAEASGELKEAMRGSGNELISSAKKYLSIAEDLDARAMPGRPGFKENLHKAVYNYFAARRLLERARDQGINPEECDRLLVRINKAVFWCKKRMPL